MPVSIPEKKFESEIEAALAAQGYEKGKPEDYHKDLVLLPKVVVRFVQVYKLVTDNDAFARTFVGWLFDRWSSRRPAAL